MEIGFMLLFITTTAFVIILAAINSALTSFLQFTFRQGAIFGSYLPFLAKCLLYLNDNKMYQHVKENVAYLPKSERGNYYIEKTLDYPLYKMLGGCGVCFNVWQGIAVWFLLFGLFLSFDYYYFWFIPFSLFSNLIYRLTPEK